MNWFLFDDIGQVISPVSNSQRASYLYKKNDRSSKYKQQSQKKNSEVDTSTNSKFWVIMELIAEGHETYFKINSEYKTYEDALGSANILSQSNAGTKFFVMEASDVFFVPIPQVSRLKL